MTRFRFSVCFAALCAVTGFSELAAAAGSSGGYGSSGGVAVAYHSASSGGSSGGYASSGGSYGGRVGPIRRLAARIQARRAAWGSSGGYYSASSGGSSGGSTGVRYVAYRSASSGGASSGGSTGTVRYVPSVRYAVPMTSYSSSVLRNTSAKPSSTAIAGYESSRVQSTYKAPATAKQPASAESSNQEQRYTSTKPALDDDAALLTVAVPSKVAKVTVNGHQTTSEGVVRQFMSRGLKDGYLYTYVVKVTYDHEGQERTDSKEVKLRPGDTERIVFEAHAKSQPKPEDVTVVQPQPKSMVTVVKLHVPQDAAVNLAGNATNGKGKVRTFRTTALKSGQSWRDYKVVVTAKIDGQPVSREQVIDVKAGSTNELVFDFAESVATR